MLALNPSSTRNTALSESASIIVIGASGDLARKKVIPALFALYCQKLLPERVKIVGFARSNLTQEQFRNMVTEHLTCRYAPGKSCGELMEQFLEQCFFVSGKYDSPESFIALSEELRKLEDGKRANRVFYMAIPPFVFMDAARSLKMAGLVSDASDSRWSRAVIEKPFGSDRESSDELVHNMAEVFTEGQTYRIDHYLGKEVIQNLLVLRFANLIFDPIWNRTCIDHVEISWKENIGVEGRGGYFDEYGIIRDVMQNHLLQILALIAMEQPVSLAAKDIRDEKVKLLRAIPPLITRDLVLGQYTEGAWKGLRHPAYLEEELVPKGSLTPTYAAAVLHITNRRWDGVPFLIQAGKGLNDRMTEIRIRFRETPGNLYRRESECLARNELVIRVQPDEAITFHIMNKIPGLKMEVGKSELNMRYGSAFQVEIPDAYECLLLDVMEGNESLFIRSDELAAAWDIFTPVLHEIADAQVRLELYPFGSHGPDSAERLAKRFHARWHRD
jgi:glucose-6-phosphate 1-dehydrogenase